jgi:AcrR family transcriptional regulator
VAVIGSSVAAQYLDAVPVKRSPAVDPEPVGADQVAETKSRKPQRTHRGRTLEERRAERRAALLDSALELFGTNGYAATSIGELCRVSYVTTRYFYEEYGDRETLLLELYEQLIAKVGDTLLAVSAPPGPDHVRVSTRARLSAIVYGITDDERVARVILLESGSALLEARRREAHQFFANFMAQITFRYVEAGEVPDTHDFELLSLMFVGAVNEAITHWVLSPVAERPDREHIIDTILEMWLIIRQALVG